MLISTLLRDNYLVLDGWDPLPLGPLVGDDLSSDVTVSAKLLRELVFY